MPNTAKLAFVTIQISVRLPAGLVQRLDEAVDSGIAATRSDVVACALEREFRRLAAERDAELLGDQTFEVGPEETDTAVYTLPRRAWID